MANFPNGLIFLLVNGLVLFSSWCISGYVLRNCQSLSLRIVATGIFSFVHVSIVVLLLGVVFRFLTDVSVPLLSSLISVLIIFSCRDCRQPFIKPARQCLADIFSRRDYFLYVITGLFVIQVVVLIGKVVWLPPHIWDVFVYHLPPAVEWFQQGFIPQVLDTTVARMNGAPLGMSLLAYWFFIFFRDDTLVEMPMLLWSLLLVPVSVAAMRQSGVSRVWSFKFAVLIFFLPIVIMQAVTVKDHLGLNVGFFAGLVFLAGFLKDRNHGYVLVAAAAFGLALGYKIAAPVHILVALSVFSVLLWFHQVAVPAEKKQQQWQALFKTTAVSAVVIFTISGYWYLRNFLVYGRLHGAYGIKLNDTGDGLVGDAGAINTMLNMFQNFEVFKTNLSELLPRIFDYQYAYGADLAHISGFGPQFAAFGLLGLVVAIGSIFNKQQRHQPAFLISTTSVLLFVAFMFININANSYRILSFFPMILIAYAGIQLFHSEFLDQKWVRGLTNSIIALSVTWCFLLLLPPQYTNLLRLKEFVSLGYEARTSANYTSWFIRPRPEFYRLMDNIPVTEAIAYIDYRGSFSQDEVEIDTWQYLYMDRHWQRKLYALHLPDYFDCQENGQCKAGEALKPFLKKNQVSLLSSCKINRCLKIRDEALIEIVPGFYYFLGDR